MGYSERPASRPLQRLVACTWALSGPGPAHRVLPDGCIDILMLGEPVARVVGTMRRAFVAPAHASAVIGIRFRPGEAARLLPAAPRELTDGGATLEDLWGDDAHVLSDALLALLGTATREGLGPDEILRRASSSIEEALCGRLAAHGEAIDMRVRTAADRLAAGASVRDTAEHVALSERQLNRRFVDRVGVPPKMFARIMRLQRAAALLAKGHVPSETASLAGYADQAHFARDSAELAGITPGILRRELSDSFNTAAVIPF